MGKGTMRINKNEFHEPDLSSGYRKISIFWDVHTSPTVNLPEQSSHLCRSLCFSSDLIHPHSFA